jgi:hypothetical protein
MDPEADADADPSIFINYVHDPHPEIIFITSFSPN